MSQPSPIPAAYAWPVLLARDGDALFDHCRHTLEELGKQPGTLALIFGKAIPALDPLKVGTLAAILGDVAAYLKVERDELLRRLLG